MKVGFVIFSLKQGGAEKVVTLISNYLVEKNVQVTIFLYEKIIFYTLNSEVKVIEIKSNNHNRLSKLIFRLKDLYVKIKKEKINVIISFTTNINFHSILVNFILRKKLIISERIDPGFLKNKTKKYLRNFLYKYTNYLVVQNNAQYEYYIKNISPKKIQIINNPIILGHKKYRNNSLKLINIGRLDNQKNHKDLILIYKKLKIKPELLIIGEGINKKILESQIKRLELSESIRLIGTKSKLDLYLNPSNIFVSSSVYEGMPNSLLEAMGSKMACVHYDCPSGLNEIIDSGKNGYLINIGDLNHFAKTLDKLIFEKSLREKIGKNAYESAKAFDINKIGLKWVELIRK